MNKKAPLLIGTKTKFGKVAAVLITGGERYYMCIKKGVVSLMPEIAIEEVKANGQS